MEEPVPNSEPNQSQDDKQSTGKYTSGETIRLSLPDNPTFDTGNENFRIAMLRKGGEQTLLHYKGEAQKVNNLKSYTYETGSVDDFVNYIAKRKKFLTPNKPHSDETSLVTIQEFVTNITARYYSSDIHETRTELGLNVSLNKDILALGINSDTMNGKDAFVKLLRKYSFLFSNRAEFIATVSAIEKLSLKVNQVIESDTSQARRGNVSASFQQEIKSDVPLSFTVTAPIIKGEEPTSFLTEICYDVKDRAVVFWLESEQLRDHLRDNLAATANNLHRRITELGVAVLRQ